MARILVVEDYPSQQFVYAQTLIKAGHQVDTAEDGNEALRKTQEAQYDLVLLDMMLKNVTGMDFLRQFKAKEHPETKVVVFSHMISAAVVQEAIELGAISYFTKSNYTAEEVLSSVDDVLKGNVATTPVQQQPGETQAE